MDNACRELPLPSGWDVGCDVDGREFYIDHNTKRTSWIDPRDRLTKPCSFADCISNELPIGWEEYHDEEFGLYYIDHINQVNQREDPREEWRETQQKMLETYLAATVHELQVKEGVLTSKTEEIEEALKQMKQFRYQVTKRDGLDTNQSLQSLNSGYMSCSSWSICTKYDPDLVRDELEQIKARVEKLRGECLTAKSDLNNTRNKHRHLKNQWETLCSGGEDSTNEMSCSSECISEPANHNNNNGRLSEEEEKEILMQKLQITNDKIVGLTKELRSLEKAESSDGNPQTLLLISEKEELLNNLYATNADVASSTLDKKTASDRCKKLEKELRNAKNFNNRKLGERLKRVERHESINRQLHDSMELVTKIENRLRSLSTSSMSLSSSSSQGSVAPHSAGLHFRVGEPPYNSVPNLLPSPDSGGSSSGGSNQPSPGSNSSGGSMSFSRRNNSLSKARRTQMGRRSSRKYPVEPPKPLPGPNPTIIASLPITDAVPVTPSSTVTTPVFHSNIATTSSNHQPPPVPSYQHIATIPSPSNQQPVPYQHVATTPSSSNHQPMPYQMMGSPAPRHPPQSPGNAPLPLMRLPPYADCVLPSKPNPKSLGLMTPGSETSVR